MKKKCKAPTSVTSSPKAVNHQKSKLKFHQLKSWEQLKKFQKLQPFLHALIHAVKIIAHKFSSPPLTLTLAAKPFQSSSFQSTWASSKIFRLLLSKKSPTKPIQFQCWWNWWNLLKQQRNCKHEKGYTLIKFWKIFWWLSLSRNICNKIVNAYENIDLGFHFDL